MGKYVIKRLLLLIPILLGVSFIIFTIMNMIPGDVASLVLGDNAPLSARQELTRELGLDKPFWLRYVDYVWNAVHGNFGLSYRTRTPVFTEIFSRFPTTMKLAAGAMLLSVAIGVPLGILSAVKQYSALDVINSVTAMFFSSIPAFWLGLLSILLFALKLGWLPSNGADTMKSFILPIVTLALPGAAEILRLTRSTMLEVIRQDYITTAEAKGQTELKIIIFHALKNALIPVITTIGIQFGHLLGGAVLTESIFAVPGVGKMMVDAIKARNYPVVQGGVLMVALTFSLVNLAVDILYAFVDPRIRSQYK